MPLPTNFATPTATLTTSAALCCTCLLKRTLRQFRSKLPGMRITIFWLNSLWFLHILFVTNCNIFIQGSAWAPNCQPTSSLGPSYYIHWTDQESYLQVLVAWICTLCSWNREVSVVAIFTSKFLCIDETQLLMQWLFVFVFFRLFESVARSCMVQKQVQPVQENEVQD